MTWLKRAALLPVEMIIGTLLLPLYGVALLILLADLTHSGLKSLTTRQKAAQRCAPTSPPPPYWVIAYDPDRSGTEILGVTTDEARILPAFLAVLSTDPLTKTIDPSRFGLRAPEYGVCELTFDNTPMPEYRAVLVKSV